MLARRVGIALLGVVMFAAIVAAMVRYTHRVEAGLTKAVPTGSVKLLKERTEVAPFTATDVTGKPISIAQLRGKVVLINFWATWCPPCREEIPALIELQKKYTDQLQIIGIAQDSGSAEDVRRFAEANGMNYPSVLSSPELEKRFPGVYALPTTFMLDHDGRIAQKHVGLLNTSVAALETEALAGTNPALQIVYAEDEDKVRLANAAQANKIPGIDLSKLPPDKKAEALKQLNSEHCTCGCGLTLAQCRLDDPDCGVSLPLAQKLVEKIEGGK
jgi:thiol-disulfide isomerase/thioredoxin